MDVMEEGSSHRVLEKLEGFKGLSQFEDTVFH